MPRSPLVFAFAFVGCGGASQPPDGPPQVHVPVQPPAPILTPTPPTVEAHLPVAAPPFSCTGGLPFKAGTRSYCGYVEPATWPAAEQRCVSNGGHLVSLETRAVSDAVHLALGSPVRARRAVWIGLESMNKRAKTWRWTTGKPLTAATWNAGEPNDWDGHENCGELLVANGRWNDTRCELRQHYLCQSSAGAQLTCTGQSFGTKKPTAYCYVAIDATYAEARTACKQMGGTLATPQTAEESEDLRRGLGQRFEATRLWTGLNDREREGAPTWASGEPYTFRAWEPGEPNGFNGREACVELFADRWRWNDLDCDETLPFVCEDHAAP